jgi:hypothetical protein
MFAIDILYVRSLDICIIVSNVFSPEQGHLLVLLLPSRAPLLTHSVEVFVSVLLPQAYCAVTVSGLYCIFAVSDIELHCALNSSSVCADSYMYMSPYIFYFSRNGGIKNTANSILGTFVISLLLALHV